jgi:hypothetical protein
MGGDPARLTSSHPRVFYCEVCGCADRTSARNITYIRLGIGSSVETRRLFSQLMRLKRSITAIVQLRDAVQRAALRAFAT